MKYDLTKKYKIIDKDDNNYYHDLDNYDKNYETENYFKFNDEIDYDFINIQGIRLA